MITHVRFLGALYGISGAIWILVGLSALALAAGAGSIAANAGSTSESSAAIATSATFIVAAIAALVLGVGHALAGRGIRRGRAWSRRPAIALGLGNLLLFPFGTALGVYTLWVLLHDELPRAEPRT